MNSVLIIVLLVTIYFIKLTFFSTPRTTNPLSSTSTSSQQQQQNRSKPILEGKFTPQTLYKFNGVDDEKIYILVKGTVYDVTRARQFYGPSGPYSNFAGHDASRGLALNSFDIDVITPFEKPIDTLEGLSTTEWESLNGWEDHFNNKYTKVGVLVNPE